MGKILGAAVSAAAMLVASAASANTTLNTFPSGAPTFSSFHTVGQGGYVTMGQTFTAPTADTYLNSYTMGLQAYLNWSLGFTSVLQAWDDVAGTTVGDVLFQSQVIYASNQTNFTNYNFATNLNLAPGGRYIAYLSTIGVDDNPEFGAFNVRMSQGDSYAAGEAWSFNTFEGGWQKTLDDGVGHDLRLVGNFSAPPGSGPVPEPAVWMTMILGLGASGAMLRRRRLPPHAA